MSMTTLADALDAANPNRLADILRLVKLGTLLTPTTATIAGVASTDVVLPLPALLITSVRVATGGAGTTAVAGVYIVQDENGTAEDDGGANKPGACTLSADGTTLTFATALAAVDSCIVCYVPQSYTDMTSECEIMG